ncbi:MULTISPECIES: TldD/PmbA family protein [Saccharothrix]|uniref:TldD/PmbA family protein n=1 Tax=Saccharothrix TaxID=2071 RepID=UPI0009F83446|nr:TldD/PmbA family protein [Saccharothrix sp. CB00851]
MGERVRDAAAGCARRPRSSPTGSRTTATARLLAEAALDGARRLGARHASFRLDRVRTGQLVLFDGSVHTAHDSAVTGLSVQVWHDGVWGFAASGEVTARSARDTAGRAVDQARFCSALGREEEPVPEPVHDGTWSSGFRINPFSVPEAERAELLAAWSARLLAAPGVEHVRAKVVAVQEDKFFADLAGTSTVQRRVRVHPQVVVAGGSTTLRTVGPPTGRGWEYLLGEGWDWDAELAALPGLLRAKQHARPVVPGTYDLVIDPSQLWLTIHESVGHATELDRVLGHEASYAGTSFVRPGDVGGLRYGTPLMTVTADRTTPHGLATVAYDDQGVAAQSWDLVRDGVLVGSQYDRRTARVAGATRSVGCAFAESALRPAITRMPNVSLAPAPGGPTTEELISAVDDGIYLVGSDSWSIDARRGNFQFTAQQAHRVHRGELAGQLSGVAYQSDTRAFWGALSAIGGAGTYQVFGADLCGKGQPVQTAAVSHGCPTAVFQGVRVRNTAGS